jgi:hypothetical protein
MNTTPEAGCGRGRGDRRGWWAAYGHPLVGSGRERGWEGGGRSTLRRDPLRGVGAVGGGAHSAAAPVALHGLGRSPSPCLEVASGLLLRPAIRGHLARSARHLTTSRGPRDEALATSRPPTIGEGAPQVSDDGREWQSRRQRPVRACGLSQCWDHRRHGGAVLSGPDIVTGGTLGERFGERTRWLRRPLRSRVWVPGTLWLASVVHADTFDRVPPIRRRVSSRRGVASRGPGARGLGGGGFCSSPRGRCSAAGLSLK